MPCWPTSTWVCWPLNSICRWLLVIGSGAGVDSAAGPWGRALASRWAMRSAPARPVADGDRLGRGGGLGGRSRGRGVGQPWGGAFGPGAVDVADQGDHRIAGAVAATVELLQVGNDDAGQALRCALGQAAIGMLRVEIGPEGLAGQCPRALQPQPLAGQQLVAQAL